MTRWLYKGQNWFQQVRMSVGYHETWSVRINKIKLGTIRSAWNLRSHKIAVVYFLGGKSLSHLSHQLW